MTMTLTKLRDWRRRINKHWAAASLVERMQVVVSFPHGLAAAFLDAHMAGMGEPVAYLHSVVAGDGEPDQALSFAPDNFPLQGVVGYRSLGHVPLYTAPPIDIAAVREVIAALRFIGDDHHDAWADKLTAALPKETP